MANREAIRDLQARLAKRLQTARAEGMSVAWLAVRAGGRNYLFPLGQSGEIFPVASLQSVPYTCDWFPGVLNIRGGLYGVVDLAAFIAAITGTPRTEPAAAEPSVVTLNSALDVNCALQVDVLLGLRGPEAFASSSAPAQEEPVFFGTRFVDAAGAAWQEINMRTLSQTPQFLSISA
jgi:twitching motility protein PilI